MGLGRRRRSSRRSGHGFDKIAAAWDFFTDHKDDLRRQLGWLSTAWEYLAEVPVSLWILLGAAGLFVLDRCSMRAQRVKKITDSVSNGSAAMIMTISGRAGAAPAGGIVAKLIRRRCWWRRC
jgi:hypothetical protein